MGKGEGKRGKGEALRIEMARGQRGEGFRLECKMVDWRCELKAEKLFPPQFWPFSSSSELMGRLQPSTECALQNVVGK